MQPFLKYIVILLACFVCILVFFTNVSTYSTFDSKQGILFQSYLPKLVHNNLSKNNNLYCNMANEHIRQRKAITMTTNLNSTTLTKTVLNSTSRNAFNKSFKTTLQSFPWTDFEDVANQNCTKETNLYSKLLIEELTYFLELEPLVKVNGSCTPPPPLNPDEIDCAKYPFAFNGIMRSTPAKIGVLIQLGFDIDILEIHFNELADVVDIFFVIESTHAHYGNIRKPLMWERVKQQERFKNFNVEHFIIDDAESAKYASDKMWVMEKLQEGLRWHKFLEWNDGTKYFNDDDILGFGDTDEIPNRAKLNMVKYCEILGDSVDFGIWVPFGHISQAFRSDYPVRGHPMTLGDPTYYKLKAAKLLAEKDPKSFPSRRRGSSKNYLLGGMHMTHYGYLPFQIVKHVTATEGGLRTLKDVQKLSNYLKVGDIRNMEVNLGATPKQHLPRIKHVDLTNLEMKEICILPWFYECNRNRYPVWEDGHDTRLD